MGATGEDAWTPIGYPSCLVDDHLGRWISDVPVAETEYTAFTCGKGQAVTAGLIVRRVTDLCRTARFTSTEVVYGVTGTEVTELPEYGVSP